MRIRFVISSLLVVLVQLAMAEMPRSGVSTIHGHLINPDKKQIKNVTVYAAKGIVCDFDAVTSSVDENGDFDFSFNLDMPITVQLTIDKSFPLVYLEPNADMSVDILLGDDPGSHTISKFDGELADINTEITTARAQMQKRVVQSRDIPGDDFYSKLHSLDSIFEKRPMLIDSLELSSKSKKILFDDLTSNKLWLLCSIYDKYIGQSGNAANEISDAFIRELGSYDLDNTGLLSSNVSAMVVNELWISLLAYSAHKIDIHASDNLEYQLIHTTALDRHLKKVMHTERLPLLLQIALAWSPVYSLKSYCTKHAWSDRDSVKDVYMRILDDIADDPLVKTRFSELIDSELQYAVYSLPEGRAKEIVDSLLNEHNGKILLLMFWGTYCAPCVKEMSEIQDILMRYRDHGDLSIVYICSHDGSLSTYDEIKGKYLQNVTSMRPPEVDFNSFKEAFGIFGVPRHIVISPTGLILNDDYTNIKDGIDEDLSQWKDMIQ